MTLKIIIFSHLQKNFILKATFFISNFRMANFSFVTAFFAEKKHTYLFTVQLFKVPYLQIQILLEMFQR